MWETFRDDRTNRVYYADRETGETSWTPPPAGVPCVPFPAEDVLANWKAYRSASHANELFFLNSLTGERTWLRPFKFRGMPEDEPEDHELGPFVQYEDENDRIYYYNPRTKYVTRQKPSSPKLILTEQEAYDQLRAKGLIWEGRPAHDEEKESTSKNHEASSTGSSTSSDDEEESDSEEEEEDPARAAFIEMLKQKGVSKVSKWPNWMPKLINEPAFQSAPSDKARAWFEEYIRETIAATSSDKAKMIQNVKLLLGGFLKGSPVASKEDAESAIQSTGSEELKQALAALKPDERKVIIAAVFTKRPS